MGKKDLIAQLIEKALQEDIGRRDLTTELLIPPSSISLARIVVKEAGTICGLEVAKRVFRTLDSRLIFHSMVKEGEEVRSSAVLGRLKGKTRAILSAERVALNFLGYLSGIATQTRKFVRKIHPFKALIMDTRKTMPTLRWLQRLAVRCGGGVNHRMTLEEMVFIKDNHWVALSKQSTRQSMRGLLQGLRARTSKPIEVEVNTLKQFYEALDADPNFILLDNMSVPNLQEAVRFSHKLKKKKKPFLEASGSIHLENVRAVAQTGVHRISIGELTHSARSIDVSLEMEES